MILSSQTQCESKFGYKTTQNDAEINEEEKWLS